MRILIKWQIIVKVRHIVSLLGQIQYFPKQSSIQWLSGRVLDSRPRGRRFEPHCVVSLNKNNNPSLVLVQPRKIRPYINERLLMRRKESKSNQAQSIECNENKMT